MSEPLVMSIEELAAHFGVTDKTVYRWIGQEKIPPSCVLRMERRVFLKRKEVERWLAAA